MLAPVRGAPGANLIHHVLPSLAPLPALLFNFFWRPAGPVSSSGSGPSGNPVSPSSETATVSASSGTVAPRVFGLLGTRNTDRIVGPATLHYVTRRHIGSISSRPLETVPLFKPMNGPYGAIINSLQPEFLKIGFSKIHEDEHSIVFSDGTHKIHLAIDRYDHSAMTELFVDKNGKSEALWILQDRLDSRDTKKAAFVARTALIEKYRMNDDDAPASLKQQGERAALNLYLKQVIQFIDTHKKVLSELK